MSEAKAGVLDEFEGKKLLKQYGVPVVQEYLAQDLSVAEKVAEKIGYPVVLKVCSAEIMHKTETGGVLLDINGPDDLLRACVIIKKRFEGQRYSLLIQKMVQGGIELIIGARRDPVFGPVVLVGLGGVLTEVIRDTSLALVPVDEKVAEAMLRRLKGFRILEGFRGRPKVDLWPVIDSITAISTLITKNPDVIEIDVNPLIASEDGAVAVDALVRLSPSAGVTAALNPPPETIDPFFNPRSVALIGASRTQGKGGNIILQNIMRAGFKGAIYPVNPSPGEILGLESYRSVDDIPGEVDLAMIVIPKGAVPKALDDCAKKGVKAVILSTGGYSDIGAQGAAEQRELVARARAGGIRLLGPNSIGTISPLSGLATSIVGLEPIQPGGVSLIGQSGVFSSGWGRWIAETRPFGISKLACIGNKGEVNESDFLEYLAGDDATSTVGLYLEGIAQGERFVRAATGAGKRKPVVVIKSGKTQAGAMAIASHTGSLAGSDDVFDAVCRRTGMVRVHDSEAFFDTLAAFEALPLPRGNRLGALSISGMGCVVSTDAAGEYGVEIPELTPETLRHMREVIPAWAPLRNPVDIWSAVEQHGPGRTMSHISGCLLDQNDIDAVLVIFVLMPESIFDIEKEFGELVRKHPGKPLLVSYYGGTESEMKHVHSGFMRLGVPTYPTPERAIYAFSRMVEYARFRGLIG
ncbi:MAG: acetate--CoA ligase family protein [Myxococcota bacterium]|jgi:acyl-CoA synthetase (NDP forming)